MLSVRRFRSSRHHREYALGLTISKYRGLPVVEHGGALFGYRTELLRFPQQKFSVITLCNLGTSNPDRLSDQVADIYLEGQLSPEAATATASHVDPQPFVGPYRNTESHSVLNLAVLNGDLVAFGEHLKSLGPTRFEVVPGVEMSFESQNGGAMRVTLTSEDTAPQIFERYEPVKPTAQDLAEYVGEYKSTELLATYRFAVKDGKLTLATNWQEPAVLSASVRDEFQSPGPFGTVIVFRRDAAGHISGCDLFAGRVRNIAFAKSGSGTVK
jgi:hypothetical protein